jgi:hypothetical protein
MPRQAKEPFVPKHVHKRKNGALDFFFPLIANNIVTRDEKQGEQSQDDGDSQKVLPAFGDRPLAGSVKLRPGKRCRWRTRFRRSASAFVERSSRSKRFNASKKKISAAIRIENLTRRAPFIRADLVRLHCLDRLDRHDRSDYDVAVIDRMQPGAVCGKIDKLRDS